MALDSLAQDARYGLRQLRRTPLFASATVLTLALTIGATSALFAIANAVVFRPLPYRESDRIVTLTIEQAGRDIGVFDEPTAELAMRAGTRTFESVAAYRTTGANLAGGAQPERVEGAVVGAGFFDVVGVRPAVGRTFAPDELQRGGPAAIVLSHALWDRAFGRSPDVVNRAVRLDDQSYAVVGVMPPGFRYPSRSEFWLPWSPRGTGRALYFTSFIGRLRPGETTAAARDELLALRRGHERDLPQRALETSIRIVPLHEALRGKFRRPFVLLLAIVGCVLLIACANVANLLMARTSVRRRELAVRVALGAQRGRLVRQLLIESLLLASLGAVPGLALAYVGMQAFTVFGPAALAQLPGIAIDGTVLLFTLVVTIGTGLLFGIAPAFAAGRADPQSWLKGSATSADRADRQRARRLLVVLELAATVVLTIGAALLAKSYVRYTATDRGFHADRVLTASVPLPRPRYADPAVRRAFSDGVLDRLRRSPAILSATHSDTMLGSMTMTIRLPAALTSTGRSSDDESFAVSFVGSDYFRTFGIPLLAGSDCPMQPDRPAAILSEPLARLMYPGRSPLGETIQLSGQGLYTIVGVAANVRALAANTNGLPKVYACAGRT
jgi:putative ABC transport system permease protein